MYGWREPPRGTCAAARTWAGPRHVCVSKRKHCLAWPAPPYNHRSQAVIGAGAAGLAAIREMLREGHTVVAFEQSLRPGGTWIYDEAATDSEPLGIDPGRNRVHSSMYRCENNTALLACNWYFAMRQGIRAQALWGACAHARVYVQAAPALSPLTHRPTTTTGSLRRCITFKHRNLRTNLPRELMGFQDLPFTPSMMGTASHDARRFCSHEEVSLGHVFL
jgi:cation diffusion facilitator CzcD-associated flavoprotein CzcO